MIVQEETKPPTTQTPEPGAKPKPPTTKEEQREWFKKQAEIDLAANKLFKGS